ncbi:MAG: Holliday junction resolvase RuvX [Candidatus Omnitrophica bacterium]|nr:Holliday junction resolvase RuvX [Candidatus Omnitrophota bacterium]
MGKGTGEVRILALDVGTVRVGVAISDPLGLTAQPLPTIQRKPDRAFFEGLAALIDEYEITVLVLGLPIGLSGQRGDSFQRVEALRGELAQRWPSLVIERVDERFTSSMAQEVTKNAPRKRKQKKGLTDQIAAQLILQDYLDRNRK